MTRFFMGDSLPYKVIDQINQRKDNPSYTDMVWQKHAQGKNNFFSPKLWGHRKYNHDPIFNVINGYQMAGMKGIEAHFWHDIEDMISDDLADKFGTDGRDIIEAFMNYSFRQHRRHDRHRRSMIKRMY